MEVSSVVEGGGAGGPGAVEAVEGGRACVVRDDGDDA